MNVELSQKDIDEMQSEIEERIKLRSALGADVVMARSYGDLSENAEYHTAKHQKNKNEGRIRYLRNLIKNAEIIELEKDKDVVGFFDKVTILFEDEGDTEDFIISSSVRIDVNKGLISKQSALGKAIFGKRIGDRLFVEVSDEVKYYVKIVAIEKNVSVDDVPINKY